VAKDKEGRDVQPGDIVKIADWILPHKVVAVADAGIYVDKENIVKSKWPTECMFLKDSDRCYINLSKFEEKWT
jgi:hypothetical protein